jgi:hypothetical protein
VRVRLGYSQQRCPIIPDTRDKDHVAVGACTSGGYRLAVHPRPHDARKTCQQLRRHSRCNMSCDL